MQDYLPQGRTTVESKPGHEADLVVVRSLVLFATILVVVIILVELILALVMQGLSREEKQMWSRTRERFANTSGEFIGPALQPKPSADLARLKQEELSRLNDYGWVDRTAGVAHIPIERAIDILARSGLPSPAAGPAGAGSPAAAKSPSATQENAGLGPRQEQKP